MDYPLLTPKVNFLTQYTYELQYLCLIYRFFYLWAPMLVILTFSLMPMNLDSYLCTHYLQQKVYSINLVCLSHLVRNMVSVQGDIFSHTFAPIWGHL